MLTPGRSSRCPDRGSLALSSGMTTSRRRRPSVTTCFALGALAAELIALSVKRPDETLCPDLRTVFFLHTPAGRVAFTVAYSVFNAWFYPHLLRGAVADVVQSDDLWDFLEADS